MSWLKDLVRPKIATKKRKEVAANVWTKCPACGEMLYEKDLQENMHVCIKCNHHLRISVSDRFSFLTDKGSEKIIEVTKPKDDPLKFKDKKKYAERLKIAREKTGQTDAFRVAVAKINKQKCVVVAMDFNFMGGSMSRHVGEAVVVASETAVKQKLPLLVITSSGGARMQEGILSLMQMARTTAALQELKEANLPYIVLLGDPTTGGVTASFATLGDLLIAEPGATIGFAGARVIRQTIGESLPEGFQKAEYLMDHGMIDMILPRCNQKETLSNLLGMLTENCQAA